MGVEIRDLKRSFGPVNALNGIDLELPQGFSCAILGPNGAGKTTLMKILAGLLRPTGGEIIFDGRDLSRLPERMRGRIGLLTHSPYLYPDLTAIENLTFFATLYRLENKREKALEALDMVKLSSKAREMVKGFSRGMVQRLSIARALIHNPDLLLLDEPYTGLDPRASEMLLGILTGLKDEKRIMLMSTHNLDWGLELSDMIAIQVKGKIVARKESKGMGRKEIEDCYKEYVESAEV